jgi:hypothetical protein
VRNLAKTFIAVFIVLLKTNVAEIANNFMTAAAFQNDLSKLATFNQGCQMVCFQTKNPNL